MLLGAAREFKGAALDPAAGVVLQVERGQSVEQGDMLAWVHASQEALADEGVRRLQAVLKVEDIPPEPRTIILEEY
jgi:thymidine phosphorylase